MISHYRGFCKAAKNPEKPDVDAALEFACASFKLGLWYGLCFGFPIGALAATGVWTACGM